MNSAFWLVGSNNFASLSESQLPVQNPGMEYFKRYAEAAQAQAKLAAASASKLAEQLGDQTKVLAEQASTYGKATAEQAQQKLKDLHLAEQLDKLAASHHQQQGKAQGPSLAELRQYGITPEFQDFVRSLTYSTFRDYPTAEVDTSSPVSTSRDMPYLLPWQERHAMLVVQSVNEINELRFVLCPKRMTDEQFWKIYFHLTKKQLPENAFNPDFVPEDTGKQAPTTNPLSGLDLQSKVQQLSSAARHFGEETTARLRSAAGNITSTSKSAAGQQSSPTTASDIGSMASRGAQDRDSTAGPASVSAHPGTDASVASRDALGLDHDLYEYLKDVDKPAGGAGNGHESGSEDDQGHDDFDKYISELEKGHESGSEPDAEEDAEGSGEELDLDEYMKEMQAEEANNGKC